MDTILGLVGLVLLLCGKLWIVAHAFGKGCLMGLACLLIPAVTPIYALFHMKELGKPLAMWVLGWLLLVPTGLRARREQSEPAPVTTAAPATQGIGVERC